MMAKTKNELMVENWNLRFPNPPVKVRFWKGAREGVPRLGEAWTEAQLLGGHTPVVYVRGHGAIALSHVEPFEKAA